VDAALHVGLPIVEDNPYGDLWFDEPPPPPLSALAGDQAVYLGSFSKVLAPGLRLGYVVAPALLYPKLLQAKQAADLHTPGFNQRVVYEVIKDGFLTQHVPTIRARYKTQRDAMQASLQLHMSGLFDGGIRWNAPVGGMFFWLELPAHINTTALLPKAVEAGMAFVPGSTFYPHGGHTHTLRLSFVTASPAQIETAVAALARVLRAA
jgi:2-aminoadipate transaminase